MSELERVAATAHALAEAISRRDGDAVARFLTPDFVLRSPGKTATGRSAFAAGILELPDGIEFVKLRDLEIDLDGDHALVTGLQHARVRIDAQNIDDIRPFVDWFVRDAGNGWRVRAALDLPALGNDQP